MASNKLTQTFHEGYIKQGELFHVCVSHDKTKFAVISGYGKYSAKIFEIRYDGLILINEFPITIHKTPYRSIIDFQIYGDFIYFKNYQCIRIISIKTGKNVVKRLFRPYI